MPVHSGKNIKNGRKAHNGKVISPRTGLRELRVERMSQRANNRE
jgi:hypothetical protein